VKIQKEHINKSERARPGVPLAGVKAIAMHWVGKADQEPEDVLAFWQNREQGYGSAHYIISTGGRIVEALPPEEVAYHVGSQTYTPFARSLFGEKATSNSGSRSTPNHYSIGIEMCHIDWEGTFTEETLEAAAKLCAELCSRNSLDPHRHIVTHNMIVGWKECPRLWVNNPDNLELFRWIVAGIL
jgi:N-acetylmuramoyl-L-alanine amidase